MNIALILAGGCGSRTQQDVPKQFMNVYEKPLIIYTLENFERHPDIDGIIEGLKCRDIRKTAACMGNVLEQVTASAYPVIEDIKGVMLSGGALNALMSGSGPTVFGLFEEKSSAKDTMRRIKELKLAKQVYVTTMHHVRRK